MDEIDLTMTSFSSRSKQSKSVGKCSKLKCQLSIPKRLPPLRPPTKKEDEVWGVMALPINWIPRSKPSLVIENLEKRREERHKAILQEVETQFQNINISTENQLRANAELIKNDYKNTMAVVENLISAIDISNEEELITLMREHFESTSEHVLKFYDDYFIQLNKFDDYLHSLEKARTESIKNVLKYAYKQFHEISYKLPFEIQQFFEYKIIEVNQMLLGNFRCYEELKLNLNVQAENSSRLSLQKVDSLKFKWRELKKRLALKQLTERELLKTNCENLMLQSEKGKETSKKFTNNEITMNRAWKNIGSFPVTSQNVIVWTSEMEEIVSELDRSARALIALYKLAIVKVFDKYFEDLQNLTDGMIETGLLDPAEAVSISTEVCKPDIESETKKYSDEIENLQGLWHSIFSKLRAKLSHTCNFLHSAAHLWDSHFLRIQETKRIVLVDLRNLIKTNNNRAKAQEIQINVGLDSLRTAPTEEKLNECLTFIDKQLKGLLDMYRKHFLSEVKVVENTKLVMTEIDVLVAELDLFLDKYQNELYVNPTAQRKRGSQCPPVEPSYKTDVIPAQMRQCEYQVDAVHNWMFGLYEAIEKYSAICKDEVVEQAYKWITEHSERIGKRYELKNSYHSSRYERIIQNVYDLRLLEIQKHKNRILRHKAGAQNEIELIKQSYPIYEAKYNEITKEYSDKLEFMDQRRKRAKRADKLRSYILEISFLANQFRTLLESENQKQKEEYEIQLSRIRKTSLKCSKKVKLFIEDGNFHPQEAKKITKDLKKFDKVIMKKYNAAMKEIQNKQKKIFGRIDADEQKYLPIFKNTLEELEFVEESVALIKNLQVALRTEVYNAKFLIKKLESVVKYIEEKQMIRIGKIEFIDNFEYDFNGIVTFFMEVHDHLYQTSPVINASSRDYREIEELVGDSRNSAEYLKLLFNCVPIKNATFMSKVCRSIYDSLNQIQTNAKKFYGKHSSIENLDLIQPNFGDFMIEILQKYIFYHFQAECVWLEHANDFLNILEIVKALFLNYYQKFATSHSKRKCDVLTKNHQELMAQFDEIKKNNLERIQEITWQLKPLHGCPSNKKLLHPMENEVEEILEYVRAINLEEMIEPYKESQLLVIELYTEELEEITNRLPPLYNNYFDHLLKIPLILQFEKKLNFIINLKESMVPEEETEYVESMYHIEIRELLIPPEYEISVEKFKQLKEGDLMDDFQTNDFHISFLAQKLQDEYDCQQCEITLIQNTFLDEYERWHKIFKDNVKKIHGLYSVKYKNKDKDQQEAIEK